jgi:hypothetical protein
LLFAPVNNWQWAQFVVFEAFSALQTGHFAVGLGVGNDGPTSGDCPVVGIPQLLQKRAPVCKDVPQLEQNFGAALTAERV